MRRDRKREDPWEGYEFMDINSHSDGDARQRREPRGRPSSSSRRSQARPPTARPRQRRPSREPPSQKEVRRRRRPPQEQPRKRKPMSRGARRVLLGFILLCMVGVTAFLCVFLLFKVRTIEITGDVVYEQSVILDICGYEEGDNLVFLTTANKERALEQQLPYIQDAEISRHFPSTLEIHITGSQVGACVSSGSQWFSVSNTGKILEEKAGPDEGVMQVTGLVLTDPVPGQQLVVQDEDHQSAFEEIMGALAELGAAGQFTSLDLTDLYNITMNYQNRVVFQMGSTVGLDYKVQYGYSLVTSTDPVYIGSDETGTLDLTMAEEVKTAYFKADTGASSTVGDSGQTSSQDNSGDDASSQGGSSDDDTSGDSGDDTSSNSAGDDTGNGDESSSSSESVDRSDGIPTTIFTG